MNKLFVMYVGTELDKNHEPISAASYYDATVTLKRELAFRFGGYSVSEVNGGYLHNDHDLAEERALRIEVTASDAQMPDIKECAAMFRDLFQQEAVLLNCTTISSDFI